MVTPFLYPSFEYFYSLNANDLIKFLRNNEKSDTYTYFLILQIGPVFLAKESSFFVADWHLQLVTYLRHALNGNWWQEEIIMDTIGDDNDKFKNNYGEHTYFCDKL